MNNPGLAVQLYTLRDLTAKDFEGAMRDIAKIGFRHVELAGYGNLTSAADAKAALDAAGLAAIAAHVSIDRLRTERSAVIEECRTLGLHEVVMPWLTEAQRPTDAAGWRALADELSDIGCALLDRGLQLSYHNHDFEFVEYDGEPALYHLFERANRLYLAAELDVYWIEYAGYGALASIEMFSGRLPLIHLKDMSAQADRRFAPVGAGILDIPAILGAAREAGVRWVIVEQDNTFELPPLEALGVSFENLRRMGFQA